jgi:hypothetical protein
MTVNVNRLLQAICWFKGGGFGGGSTRFLLSGMRKMCFVGVDGRVREQAVSTLRETAD